MRRILPLALVLSAPALVAQSPLLDDGRLDPAWFGPEVKLAPALSLDYAWVKPGLSLKGKRLQVLPWQYGNLLDPKADGRDQVSAGYFTGRMPRMLEEYLRSAWGANVAVGAEPGDFQMVGRIVDTSIQSMGGRFWMGMLAAQHFTFDLKILDKEGHAVAAAHHRWGVPGGQDPFRSMGEDRVFTDLRPFVTELAPLDAKEPEWPKAFALSGSQAPAMDASGEDGRSSILYGPGGPLQAKGKTLKVEPWRVSEDEYAPRDQEYGVSAAQTAALLAQAFSKAAPAPGAAADFTLKGVLRAKKDTVLYQASLADAAGKEVFRMEQLCKTDRSDHLEGRDPEFAQTLIAKLQAGGFPAELPTANPSSLLPAEAAGIAKDDQGFWSAPGLNLTQARISVAPWSLPSPAIQAKPEVWIHACAAARALPGLLAGSFVQGARANGLVAAMGEDGATHRLEGQIVDLGGKKIGALEARLVDLATGKAVWAMRLKLEEASGRDDQAHDTMEQLVDDGVLKAFAALYKPAKR